MNKRQVTTLAEKVEREFLPHVRKPSRYIGGEINQSRKNLRTCEVTVALCFPDVYEIGMSHTGMAIIYDVLNKIESVAAERVFAPWIDAEEILRKKNIPLFSLESKASLKSFDVVGFSLTNELCYTNVLNMLDLGEIAVRSKDRGEDEPLVIAGGGQADYCEPMAEFVDLFVLGEAEAAVVELMRLIAAGKKNGATKEQILLSAAKEFEWAYVPELYEFETAGPCIKSFRPRQPDLRCRFKNAVVEDFENAPVPLSPIVPFTQAVHERVTIEIMRGCPGRCRFCQASFCRRPIRYRSVERIIEIAKACHHATGFDTVSLLSLSTAEYPKLEELVAALSDYFHEKHVGISVPSLRVDRQLQLLPRLVTSVRKSGLTIAVEAAAENIRQTINKPLKDEDLFAAVEEAYRAGWQRFKLYFMVGLPGETENDIRQIAHMAFDLAKLRKKIDGKTGEINVAVSWFVPKPHTPFAWLAQKPKTYFENAKQLILDEKRSLRAKFLQFKFHNIERSILESAMGRGDRRLADVVEQAWRNGARFDLWDECFDYELWQKAFEESALDLETAAQKKFETDELLPWQHLAGPERKYLLTHLEQALNTPTT